MACVVPAFLAVLLLATQTNGQPATIKVTATNNVEALYIDNEEIVSLPNRTDWRLTDTLQLETYTRLISIRASNTLGGCSGVMVAASGSPLEYDFVSDKQWRCSATAGNGWELIGYDDSDWLAASEIARNGDIVTGCSWFIISDMPTTASWIWTEASFDGDEVVHCRGYTPVCDAMPCRNGGTCQINSGELCQCPAHFTGRLCEMEINECDSNPCQHGGQCQLDDQGYTCECGINFTGTHCETDISPCSSQPCLNGATCIFDSEGGYDCACGPGYTGLDCEIDIDECASDPCLNDATCHDGINSITCDCPPGFTGILCQIDINECASNPCQNAGTCVDRPNGYTCTCHPGYTGAECETGVGACETNPCQNGGTCTLSGPGGEVLCICEPGWLDPLCSTNENECYSNPCQNGATCIDGEGRFDCVCPPIYQGTTCTEVIPNCGDIMVKSQYTPTNDFWILCEINLSDHASYLSTPCRDLIVGINHYNDSSTILATGGNFGCFPTKFSNEVTSSCVDNYNQDRTLSGCLTCTVMGVCIRVK